MRIIAAATLASPSTDTAAMSSPGQPETAEAIAAAVQRRLGATSDGKAHAPRRVASLVELTRQRRSGRFVVRARLGRLIFATTSTGGVGTPGDGCDGGSSCGDDRLTGDVDARDIVVAAAASAAAAATAAATTGVKHAAAAAAAVAAAKTTSKLERSIVYLGCGDPLCRRELFADMNGVYQCTHCTPVDTRFSAVACAATPTSMTQAHEEMAVTSAAGRTPHLRWYFRDATMQFVDFVDSESGVDVSTGGLNVGRVVCGDGSGTGSADGTEDGTGDFDDDLYEMNMNGMHACVDVFATHGSISSLLSHLPAAAFAPPCEPPLNDAMPSQVLSTAHAAALPLSSSTFASLPLTPFAASPSQPAPCTMPAHLLRMLTGHTATDSDCVSAGNPTGVPLSVDRRALLSTLDALTAPGVDTAFDVEVVGTVTTDDNDVVIHCFFQLASVKLLI